MTPKKGRNVAASHRAKLLTLARDRGEDFQFLLGRWVVERFLYRLAGSVQKDSFVLKGAMLFLAWEGRLHRPTKDLDLLGFGSSDVLDVTHQIREVCAVAADDGIVFDLAGIQGERIKEDAEYEGVRVRVPASLDGARVSMQIDVGFGDLVDPPPAEIDFELLAGSVRGTFERRRTPLPEGVPMALTGEFLEDHSKQTQWAAFGRRLGLRDIPPLPLVGEQIAAFLMPLIVDLRAANSVSQTWAPGGPWVDRTTVAH